MDNNIDLSSLVSLIMQNPEIISQIAALAEREKKGTQPTASEVQAEPVAAVSAPGVEVSTEAAQESESDTKRINRKRLFSALKPYLSDERAKTLSSVEAVVAILDSLKL